MGNDIRLSVTGDTQALVDAVKKGAIAVENLKDVLGDSGDAGKGAGRDIERGMKDAQKDTKDLKTDIKTATDAFEKAGRAGRDLGDNVYKGTDKAREGVREIGRESASTAKESAASFDGSAESIADSFQEVAANAFAGFGPAGLVAGVAAAAGLGAVTTEITKQQDAAKELRDNLVGAYLDASIAGRNFLTEEETIAAARAVIEKDDDARRDKRQKDAELLGLTTSTLILAESGDRQALSEIEDRIAAKRSAADAIARDNGEAGRDRASDESIALDIVSDKWDAVRDSITEATAKGEELSAVQIEQKRKTADAQNAMIGGYASQVLAAQSVKDAVLAIPTTTNVKIKVSVDESEYDSFKRRAQAGITTPLNLRIADRQGGVNR